MIMTTIMQHISHRPALSLLVAALALAACDGVDDADHPDSDIDDDADIDADADPYGKVCAGGIGAGNYPAFACIGS